MLFKTKHDRRSDRFQHRVSVILRDIQKLEKDIAVTLTPEKIDSLNGFDSLSDIINAGLNLEEAKKNMPELFKEDI